MRIVRTYRSSISSIIFLLFISPLSSFAVNQELCGAGQVAGIVYRDFNYNGTREQSEPGEAGIVVRAFNGSNVEVAADTTDEFGFYLLNYGDAPVRVEFQNIPSNLFPGPEGEGSVTTVAFPDDGDCDVNLALVTPGQYCDENPILATPRYVNGDSSVGRIGVETALFAFPYTNAGEPLNGNGPLPLAAAKNSEIASTWGIAYQRSTKTVFASAVLKRHADLGSLGTGGIYAISPVDSATPTVLPFIDLQTLGIDTGVDPRTISGEQLAQSVTQPSFDSATFSKVGKVGLAGMAMSDDDKTLYLVNLNDRTLYSLFVGNPATAPGVDDVEAFAIPNPGCSDDDYIPWAVNIHTGKVYVGVTCTAETSQNAEDLHAYILRLDGSAFTEVFDFALDYRKGFGIHPGLLSVTDAGYYWKPWARDFNDVTTENNFGFAFIIYPQAILSSIAFENDGSLYIGVMDRSGHQYGPWNYAPEIDNVNFVNGPSAGDLLLACKIGQNINGDSIFELENNAACTGHGPSAGANQTPAQGPGGGEFFYEDRYNTAGVLGSPDSDTHQETAFGAIVKLPGTDELKVNSYDLDEYEDGGVRTFSTTDGGVLEHYQLYQQEDVDLTIPGASFGKAVGLGDLELLCDPAPIEIGNRVWLDLNENGTQDAGESDLEGVTVRLLRASDLSEVSSKLTEADGTYYFRSSDGVEPNTNYLICLNQVTDFESGGVLNGLALTTPNSASDSIDSDATLVNSFPCIAFTTGEIGENDHTLDFGLIQTQCVEQDIYGINVEIDGASLGLLLTEKQAIKQRTALEASAQCAKLSTKKKKALLAESELLHQQIWTETWANGNSVTVCDQNPIISCNTYSIQSTIDSIDAKSKRMRDIVYETLSCKGKSKKKSALKKKADSHLSDVDAGLTELGSLGSLSQCGGAF